MYERPFAKEYLGERARVEVPRPTSYAQAAAWDGTQQRVPIVSRVIKTLVVFAPSAAGMEWGHPVLGLVGSAVGLLVVGLLAFGASILDDTIELY